MCMTYICTDTCECVCIYRDTHAYIGRLLQSAKVMPPISLCWPVTSEVDAGGTAVEVEPSQQYSVPFCCRATDGSRGAV